MCWAGAGQVTWKQVTWGREAGFSPASGPLPSCTISTPSLGPAAGHPVSEVVQNVPFSPDSPCAPCPGREGILTLGPRQQRGQAPWRTVIIDGRSPVSPATPPVLRYWFIYLRFAARFLPPVSLGGLSVQSGRCLDSSGFRRPEVENPELRVKQGRGKVIRLRDLIFSATQERRKKKKTPNSSLSRPLKLQTALGKEFLKQYVDGRELMPRCNSPQTPTGRLSPANGFGYVILRGKQAGSQEEKARWPRSPVEARL